MKSSDRRAVKTELEPTGEIPSEGEMRVRVRYCECDPMGVAHHSACVAWFEMGRTELLRGSGVSYLDMERAGLFLVVTRLDIRYRSPARYDEELVLLTRVTKATRARLDHAYELWREEEGRGRTDLLCTAESTLACVDEQGRVRELPGWLRGIPE